MDKIEQVLTEESAELIIDKVGHYWRATIRNGQFGEIVDASIDAYHSDLEGLLEKLNQHCGEWLAEQSPA